jgi:hypothetical protein
VVTYENGNRAPRFGEAYKTYVEQLAVILLKVGQASTDLELACTALGVAPRLSASQLQFLL